MLILCLSLHLSLMFRYHGWVTLVIIAWTISLQSLSLKNYGNISNLVQEKHRQFSSFIIAVIYPYARWMSYYL